MQLLTESRAFWGVLGLALLANLLTALPPLLEPTCCAPGATVGFPFPLYDLDLGRVYVTGLLLDLALPLTLAAAAAWIGQLWPNAD